jgi:hypothetical protein
VADDAGVGVGLSVGVGVPSNTTMGLAEETRSMDKDPEEADGTSPSCATAKRRNRAAKNQ